MELEGGDCWTGDNGGGSGVREGVEAEDLQVADMDALPIGNGWSCC